MRGSTSAELNGRSLCGTEPRKQVEQGSFPSFTSSYMSYRVVTHTTLASYKDKEFNVRRRFKDFVVRPKDAIELARRILEEMGRLKTAGTCFRLTDVSLRNLGGTCSRLTDVSLRNRAGACSRLTGVP